MVAQQTWKLHWNDDENEEQLSMLYFVGRRHYRRIVATVTPVYLCWFLAALLLKRFTRLAKFLL